LPESICQRRAEGGINRGAACFGRHIFADVGQVAVVTAQVAAVREVEPGGEDRGGV